MKEIIKPLQDTYWIAYSKSITHYGICKPGRVVQTGQPNLWTTTNEDEWIKKLETEFNTNPFPPEPGQELE